MSYIYICIYIKGMLYRFLHELKKRNLTCKTVSLMTKPPAETVFTNFSLSFLLLVNRYAASGFPLEIIISKHSSNLSTFLQNKKDKSVMLHVS